MKEFIINSRKTIETQYLRERTADYETKHQRRIMYLGSTLEKHGTMIYKEMFRRFQVELTKSHQFII